MSKVSRNISLTLKEYGAISNNQVDICTYGLDTFASTFIEIFAILFVASVMDVFVETALLFVTFIPLRIFAGGYHADTRLRCFLVSLVVYVAFYLTLELFHKHVYMIITFGYMIFTLIVVLLYAPVVHKNKSINETERKYYRKISIIITLAEMFLITGTNILFDKQVYSLSMATGQFAVSVSMIMALVKDKVKERRWK